MIVEVRHNRTDQKRVLAFIRFESRRHGKISVPAYFDKGLAPEPGELEVMICGVLHRKNSLGHMDLTRPPKCFFISEPSPMDTPIEYEGFEKFPHSGSTTSRASSPIGPLDVTPGRLFKFLPCITHTGKARDTTKLVPGCGWARFNEDNQMWRLEGVHSPKELIL